VRLRELGVTEPATLVIPCFKNGIDPRMKQQVLPLLNQARFDTDFESLAQEFQRISIGMAGAAGAEGQALASQGRGWQNRPRKKQKAEARSCFVCGKKGHLARDCDQRKNGEEKKGQQGAPKGPLVLMHEGASSSSTATNIDGDNMLFDSGATHHIVCQPSFLRNMRYSNVSTITLGGGENHSVRGEGDLLLYSTDTGMEILLTDVLCVPSLSWNLCSGAQLTSKGVLCQQKGTELLVTMEDGTTVLRGERVNNLYFLNCVFVLPAEGQAHVSLSTWHNRLGHPALSTLKRMARNKVVLGLGDIHKEEDFKCDVCTAAKLEKASHPRSTSRARTQCELIHTDLMCLPNEDGLLTEKGGYILTVMDDFSRYAEVAVLSSKRETADVFMVLVKRMERQTASSVKKIRCDRGKEYAGVKEWVHDQGIVVQAVPAYTPQSNGRSERLNRTLLDKARALLCHFSLPLNLWQFAIQVAALARNVTQSIDNDMCPFEKFFEVKPRITHFKVFGCLAHVLIPNERRTSKFETVAETGILVGYAVYSKAWRILVSTDNGFVIRETLNVAFDEYTTCEKLCAELRHFPDADVRQADGAQYVDLVVPRLSQAPTKAWGTEVVGISDSAPTESISENTSSLLGHEPAGQDSVQQNEAAAVGPEVIMDENVVPEAGVEAEGSSEPGAEVGGSEVVGGEEEGTEATVIQEEAESVSENEPETRRYPKRNRKAINQPYDAYLFLSEFGHKPPESYAKAKASAEWPLWRAAMNAELQSLFEKGVYEDISVDEMPEDKKAIPSKWVYSYKTDTADAIVGHKARCVGKGFYQTAGVDYTETTSPTIQDATLRVLLQFAATWKLTIHQIDVKTAFLNGELIEEVYILPPPGLPLQGRVWRLNKALSGLKQAARAWYQKWTEVLLAIGLKPSDADPCLFTAGEGPQTVRVGLYVDDALVFGTMERCAEFVAKIQKEFEIKDLGPLKPGVPRKFLGMELERKGGDLLGIVMKQEVYAKSIVQKFMPGCNPVLTPMVPGTQLTNEGEPLPEDNEYAAIVGSVLYLSVNTRPDIAYAVGVLARFMSCPKVPHLKATKHVIRYIAKDPAAGIFFHGRTLAEKRQAYLSVSAYTDADFAGDLVMRKSTSGLLCTANEAPVIWRSKLQTIVAQSTAEAEFVSASMAVRDILWLHKLLCALKIPRQSIDLYCDNESALRLMQTENNRVCARSKHIDLQYWFIVDHIMKKDIEAKFIASKDMRADCFTKPYSGPATQMNLSRIGMCGGMKDD
jgi:hypothetical protein